MGEPEVALVYSPRDWAERLTRFAADHGELRVRAQVLDEADALEQEYRVLVLDDFTHFLSRRFVDRVHAQGRTILGVYDPAELGPDEILSAGKERLRQCEVDDVIEAQATPAEFAASIKVLTATAAPTTDEELRTPAAPADWAPGREEHAGGGVVTAVAAASGGAGATEIAIGLAAAAAARRESAVLVDADDVAPSVAQRLGLPLWPNIRAAVDAHHERPEELPSALVPFPPGGFGPAFEVVPGLGQPRDWTTVRPRELVGVARDLAAGHHHVIVNAGPRIEDLSWLGEPERYGAARALFAAADATVVVALPSPTGVARLLAWVAEARAVGVEAPVHVAFNRAPSAPFKRSELEEEVRRSVSPASVSFVPHDPRVEAAAWEGKLPEMGPFRKAVGRLAAAALPMLVEAPRRRRSVLGRSRR